MNKFMQQMRSPKRLSCVHVFKWHLPKFEAIIIILCNNTFESNMFHKLCADFMDTNYEAKSLLCEIVWITCRCWIFLRIIDEHPVSKSKSWMGKLQIGIKIFMFIPFVIYHNRKKKKWIAQRTYKLTATSIYFHFTNLSQIKSPQK